MINSDMINYIKNPIVLGILAVIITYSYLYWEEKNKLNKKKSTKQVKVNIMIPGVIGAVVWLCSSYYFDHKNAETDIVQNTIIENSVENVTQIEIQKAQKGGFQDFSKSKVGRINIPSEDVFLDIATF